ncbi:zinc-ribbon domain-containing protein [Halovenus sp. WSH3]|uniref:Zinc-ribbon domain-containing protein n=1 Tax=Halovenus carboxidivorans TaxID=2692199 RepID=A0A6B0T4Q0_9EURY|nr:zinc ribbon domain-containing protein [Halovenus carboxidivorans]MXR50201.1 zinc-ribbon domain-containing protein [Halovenus carboxidivorans]
MYCPACGEEIPDGSNFCAECGTDIQEYTGQDTRQNTREYNQKDTGAVERGTDYDFVMSIQDGFKRTKFARGVIDFTLAIATAGFWLGIVAVEFVRHHYHLRKGKVEPYQEGQRKQWHLFE